MTAQMLGNGQFQRVGVAGSTGYSGKELLKILEIHPYFRCESIIDRESDLNELSKNIDLAILCTPPDVSMKMAAQLIGNGITTIDVSGAFRLKNHSYEEWYGMTHQDPQLISEAILGLYPWKKVPAVNSAETQGLLIANPGCYATAAMMTLIPLIKANLLDTETLFIDAKSGSSGAGKKLNQDLMFSELNGNFWAYKIGKHQHWPEIVEGVFEHTGVTISPSFSTQILPLDRGIQLALHAKWNPEQSIRDSSVLEQCLLEAYSEDADILVSSDASETALKKVQHSNQIRFSVHNNYGNILVLCAIDNLQRGAVGQAIMNANQIAGLNPHLGLQ